MNSKKSNSLLQLQLPIITMFVFGLFIFVVIFSCVTFLGDADNFKLAIRENNTQLSQVLLPDFKENLLIGNYAKLDEMINNFSATYNAEIDWDDGNKGQLQSYANSTERHAPQWFYAALNLSEIKNKYPLIIGGVNYGTLTVTKFPIKEAELFWENFITQVSTLSILTIPFVAFFYYGTKRVIRKLSTGSEIAYTESTNPDSAAAITQSEYFSQLLDSTDLGILGIDLNGHVIYSNKKSETLTGWPITEARHTPFHFVFSMLEFKEEYEAAKLIGSIGHCQKHIGILLGRAGKFNIEYTIRRIVDDSGNLASTIIVFNERNSTLKGEH